MVALWILNVLVAYDPSYSNRRRPQQPRQRSIKSVIRRWTKWQRRSWRKVRWQESILLVDLDQRLLDSSPLDIDKNRRSSNVNNVRSLPMISDTTSIGTIFEHNIKMMLKKQRENRIGSRSTNKNWANGNRAPNQNPRSTIPHITITMSRRLTKLVMTVSLEFHWTTIPHRKSSIATIRIKWSMFKRWEFDIWSHPHLLHLVHWWFARFKRRHPKNHRPWSFPRHREYSQHIYS